MKFKINNFFSLIVFIWLLPMNAFAAGEDSVTTVNTDPMSGHYLVQLIIGLVVVLLCILALAWFAKRMNHLQASGDGMLKILGGLSMGTRERVVLLQVGSDQLLIGVSPGRINTLHVLAAPIDSDKLSASPASGKSFSEKLAGVMNAANVASVKHKSDPEK